MDETLAALAARFKSTDARDVVLVLESRREHRTFWSSLAASVFLEACLVAVAGWKTLGLLDVDGGLLVPGVLVVVLWAVAGFLLAMIVSILRLRREVALSTRDHLEHMIQGREWVLWMYSSAPAIAYLTLIALGLAALGLVIVTTPSVSTIVGLIAVLLVVFVVAHAAWVRRRTGILRGQLDLLRTLRAELDE